jgi:ceramide glucosyltransferase
MQQYGGPVQILFAVSDAADPVCDMVRRLLSEFPKADAELVVCGSLAGANSKVAKLARIEPLAKHEILIISDADVRVAPDFLSNLLPCFHEPSKPFNLFNPINPFNAPSLSPGASGAHASRITHHSGHLATALVTCFYRLANPTTLAMHWEAIAINADFWSQVLQSQSLKPIDFALGAVMAVRRSALREIGGFAALIDCLADDYQLGHRIASRGSGIVIAPIVAECWSGPMGWAQVWKHQLRWARTIRVCQPLPYFFSILSNATLWPLVLLAVSRDRLALVLALGFWLVRIAAALDLQTRLTRSRRHFRYGWLIPVKDLLQAALWLLAFLGNRIEWRGQRLRLRRDGTLVR